MSYNTYKWVQTKEVPKYPLWIGDTQVTSVNHSGPNWFYNIDTKTLRLYGSDYGSGEYDDGGVTVDYGVRCAMTDLTINVLTDSTVEGSGIGDYSYGIFAPGCNLNIIGDGKLTAEGGSGTGDGSKGFTAGIKAETANVKGKLECLGGYSTKGISASRGIEVQKVNVGGELTAIGMGYGIYRSTDGVTIEKGSKAEIIGEISCIAHGIVKNAILGTGWTNTEGTEGAALIKVGNTGHDLSNFKKALFPTEADPATVIAKPTGKNLTYNGSAQELVTAGKAENGEMQYAIGKDKETAPTSGWSTSIPKGTKAGTYYVWYKAVGDKMHIDSEAACVTATIKEAPKPTPTPTPTPTKVSGMLMTKMKAKGKTGMTVSWNRIKGAAGYEIFFAQCNHNGKQSVCKKAKNIKGNKTFVWKKSGLKKGTAYKAYVKAYVYKDGKKKYVHKSPLMHAYTGKGNKKYTNAKSVKIKNVKKGKLTLKKGKTFKIKAKVAKVKKSKKLMPKGHAPVLRYISSNKRIATVSKSGKIKAKGKGKCTVYAYAHNGASKAIKLTVK